jgi:hypothetical protein
MQARSAQNRARRPAAVHKQRPAHASWAQRPQDRQAARGAWRSSSLTQPTQPPPRCSRSALLTLLTAPAEPDPEGLPGAVGCSWGPKRLPGPASGLPAGCLPLQCCLLLELCLLGLSARALLQRLHPCSGPGQSDSSWICSGVLGVPRVALGGSRNVFGGQDLKSTGFEFRPLLSMLLAQFRCQLNREPQSRHPAGPGRTLVCIWRTSGARAVPPPS